ncbi:AMP-binding protein [Alcanivorax sp. IO_7]|nr:AMP-binding protein [Alcanivorax sp. IO_7]
MGLLLPNTPHYAIAFLAILRAGGTVVNYSPLDAERTLAHKIEDSRTDVLITLDLQDLYRGHAGCWRTPGCGIWWWARWRKWPPTPRRCVPRSRRRASWPRWTGTAVNGASRP